MRTAGAEGFEKRFVWFAGRYGWQRDRKLRRCLFFREKAACSVDPGNDGHCARWLGRQQRRDRIQRSRITTQSKIATPARATPKPIAAGLLTMRPRSTAAEKRRAAAQRAQPRMKLYCRKRSHFHRSWARLRVFSIMAKRNFTIWCAIPGQSPSPAKARSVLRLPSTTKVVVASWPPW